jgi:hypothetical protein
MFETDSSIVFRSQFFFETKDAACDFECLVHAVERIL